MNKTAVVFGSSGLIGKSLLSQLIVDTRYNEILVFNRRSQNFKNSKIKEIITDFNNLENYSVASNFGEIYCCIGSTMKKSKTKEAFISVDFDIPVRIAKFAENQMINKLLIVSSIDADANSKNFYLQTKGKMEQSVLEFSINKIHFLRPSMLLGKRDEIRIAEVLGQIIMNIFSFIFVGKLKKYKAIEASVVAKAMINIANSNIEKTFIESNKIFELAK